MQKRYWKVSLEIREDWILQDRADETTDDEKTAEFEEMLRECLARDIRGIQSLKVDGPFDI